MTSNNNNNNSNVDNTTNNSMSNNNTSAISNNSSSSRKRGSGGNSSNSAIGVTQLNSNTDLDNNSNNVSIQQPSSSNVSPLQQQREQQHRDVNTNRPSSSTIHELSIASPTTTARTRLRGSSSRHSLQNNITGKSCVYYIICFIIDDYHIQLLSRHLLHTWIYFSYDLSTSGVLFRCCNSLLYASHTKQVLVVIYHH
jgi:DNA mismatch repair ATPase MutL